MNVFLPNPLLSPNMEFSTALYSLTVKEIKDAIPQHMFCSGEKCSHAKLEEAAYQLPADCCSLLTDVALSKQQRKEIEDEEIVVGTATLLQPLSDSTFFKTMSEDCWWECLSNFIDATGTKALTTASCAICAGMFFIADIQKMLLLELQKKKILSPAKPHPAHVLADGMLLHDGDHRFSTDSSTDSVATDPWSPSPCPTNHLCDDPPQR